MSLQVIPGAAVLDHGFTVTGVARGTSPPPRPPGAPFTAQSRARNQKSNPASGGEVDRTGRRGAGQAPLPTSPTPHPPGSGSPGPRLRCGARAGSGRAAGSRGCCATRSAFRNSPRGGRGRPARVPQMFACVARTVSRSESRAGGKSHGQKEPSRAEWGCRTRLERAARPRGMRAARPA